MGVTDKDLKGKKIISTEYIPEKFALKISEADVSAFKEKEIKLSQRIGKIKIDYEIKSGLSSTKSYEELSEICQISVTALKYAIANKKGNTATRNFLYKLAVGLHMSIDEANELFELENGKLNESCLCDLICICALRDGDSIYDFIDEFYEKTNLKIGLRDRITDKKNKS